MQNLKSPPSVSDSAASTNGHSNGYTNGRANGRANGHSNGYANGSSGGKLNGALGAAPYKPVPKTPLVIPPHHRSLRLHLRFLHALLFSAWLFARVLFWYVWMQRVFGSEAVMRGHNRRLRVYASEYRRFAVALGAMHIKLGQFVSTRIDILPEEVIAELASLQDEVPSAPFSKIRPLLQEQLGALALRFKWLNEEPVAAASLGQVYRGQLHNGDRVVVKVLRPGIREVCYTDLAALRIIGSWAMRVKFIARRANVPALVEEFGRVLLQELSYEQEARHAERFSSMFADDHGVYIPRVYREHSTDSVITIEDVTSIKVNDFGALEAAGISRKQVAQRLMDSYLKMVFEHHFFHADAHPGNLFVYPLPKADEEAFDDRIERPFYLIFVDFGMTGTLTPQIAQGMVSTLTAVLARDARRLVLGYQELGLLLPDADLRRLEEATEATFNQVWGMNMSQLKNIDYKDVAELGNEFNDLIYNMPFYLPQDFIYLGRAMGILSGLCTSLDPTFNPWQELQPYAHKLLANGFGANGHSANGKNGSAASALNSTLILQNLFNGNAAAVLNELGTLFVNNAVTAPIRANNLLERMERGDLRVISTPDSSSRKHFMRIEAQSRRTTQAVMFGSLMITGTLLYTHGDGALALIAYVFSGLTLWSMWMQGE
ncbi:MAG: hypothetical protein HXY40_13225 [Chloroflexi bacterium]|nr:hypothetical protein [Chloroflexota bacterium]